MCALEAKGALPGAGFGVTVFEEGERKLVLVVVPRAEEVYGSHIRGGAEGEGELHSGARHGGRLGKMLRLGKRRRWLIKKVPLDDIEAIILDVAQLGVPNKDGKNEKKDIRGKKGEDAGSRRRCVVNRASSTDKGELAEALENCISLEVCERC